MDDTRWTRHERPPHAWLRCALVALGYAGTGLLCRLVAVEPGYASAIWPAAGIALAGVLLWGVPAAVGVALGSFLVNLTIAVDRGIVHGALLAVVIALGAVLQAAVGAALVRTAHPVGNPLDRAGTVAPILLLGGPVACMLNPAWSVPWLWLAGEIAPADVVANWFTWWAGDSIGVMFVAPLLLSLSLDRRRHGRHLWLGITVPLAVSFVVVVAVFVSVARADEEGRRHVFDDHAGAVLGVLARDVERTVAYAESTSRVLGVLPDVTGSAIRAVTTPWLEVTPSLRALAYAPLVRAADLPEFERRIRLADDPGFRVRDFSVSGEDVTLGARPEYAPVLYVEPYQGERTARGVDLSSEPRRAAALEAARASGRAVLSGGVRLFNAPEGYGAILVSPVYGGLGSAVGDGAPVRGFLVAVLHVPALCGSALARAGVDDVRLRITDASESPPLVLYGSEWEVGDEPVLSRRLEVGTRTWRVDAAPLVPPSASWTGFFVLSAGVLFVGVLVSNVLDMTNRASQIEREVDHRTAALARANAALERSNLELQRFAYAVSHDLREPLRGVVGFGELLEAEHRDQLDADGQGLLRRVIVSARRTQDRVHALLEVARAGGRSVPFERVSLHEPLGMALEGLHDAIVESGAEVKVESLPEVCCDREQIAQLFSTLLSNALKFRRPEVPAVIEVSARELREGWEIAVRDNGVGIPRHQHARVFELFERVGPPEDAQGYDMGLALARQIVERHGGVIEVESEPGAGSAFRFTLPDRPGT